MSARPHTHEGGIVERRLRPIYDWLDNGNNKKALQEAEKVLKKSPTLQSARALKAIALLRLGKDQEAQAILDVLVDEKPSDETTLQAMTISYRETQQLHKICAIFETAVKVEPKSEELYSHLFMSYVRVNDYKSQQHAAMALYKFAPKNPYYFWAVMSIVLQAKSTEDKTKKSILLTLAQRMVDNFIAENKIEAEQEIQLYLMILELQEKWDVILQFIETPLYNNLMPGSAAQVSIPYLKKLGHWKKLNLLCKDLLWHNLDRWDYYSSYLDSVFELMKSANGDNAIDDTPEKCHEFICQLVENMPPGKSLRGPYLARLELWKRLAEEGDPTSLLGSGVALCVQYLRIFGNKQCAIPDLRPYFPMIPQAEREEHCRDFLTCLGLDENSEPEKIEDVQRHLSCLTAWRLNAPVMHGTECIALATMLRRHYLRSLQKGLVTATVTEFCSADGYGILAAHYYFYGALEQQSGVPIIEALCLLELVLHHSPANFHAKLLLLSLYHILGNALAADSIYQRLEVKHIQLLSLSWLHSARLAPACLHTRACQLLNDTRAFHSHHGKDCMEHLTYAYKYGTFEKLVELKAWGHRLEACACAAAAARDLALLNGSPVPPPLPSTLSDNRDLNVILNFEPPQCQDPHLKTRTFEKDVAYLRLKDGISSSILLCIEISDSKTLDEKKKHYEQLKTCLVAFSSAIEKCRELYSGKEKISISGPLPSRIIAFISSPVPYREMYTNLFNMTADLCIGESQRVPVLCNLITAALEISHTSMQTLMVKINDMWHIRDCLEHLSHYIEYLRVMICLLGVCNEVLAPANTKKSKKKTNQSPDDIKTIQVMNKLNETAQTSITFLENIFDQITTFTYENTLVEEMKKLSLNVEYQCPVGNKLKNGQTDMVSDVKITLKKLLKQLKGLLL